DRVLPETLALMRLIDDTEPAFFSTLHNAETGGVFYYLNRPVPELHAVLKDLPARYGVPLHAGEAEHPAVKSFEQAIYQAPTMEDAYDYLEANGQDPVQHISGAASDSYIKKYGTLGLTAEIPYWTDPSAADTTPTARSYRDVVGEQARGLRETHETLARILASAQDDLVTASPFLRASRAFIPLLGGMAETDAVRAGDPSSDRPATVAEVSSCRENLSSMRLRFGGILLRALEGELAIGNVTPAIRAAAGELSELHTAWCAEGESPARAIPIHDLGAIQYGAVLAGPAHAYPVSDSDARGRRSPSPYRPTSVPSDLVTTAWRTRSRAMRARRPARSSPGRTVTGPVSMASPAVAPGGASAISSSPIMPCTMRSSSTTTATPAGSARIRSVTSESGSPGAAVTGSRRVTRATSSACPSYGRPAESQSILPAG